MVIHFCVMKYIHTIREKYIIESLNSFWSFWRKKVVMFAFHFMSLIDSDNQKLLKFVKKNINQVILTGTNLQARSLCHRLPFWRRFVVYAVFWLANFSKSTLYFLIIIRMGHMNLLDFDDKSDKNCRISFANLGIIFNSGSTQYFPHM